MTLYCHKTLNIYQNRKWSLFFAYKEFTLWNIFKQLQKEIHQLTVVWKKNKSDFLVLTTDLVVLGAVSVNSVNNEIHFVIAKNVLSI